jgi:type IV pilus assembly protein PilB
MATEAPKKIGELLLEKKYVTPDQIKTALDIQKKTGKKLGHILVDAGIIHEDQLVEAISERLKIPRINIASMVINPEVIKLVPVNIARKYNVLPVLRMENNLTVAMVDPLDIVALDQIRYHTKCTVKRVVVGEKEIKEAIDKYYSVADSVRNIIGDDTDEIESIEPDIKSAGEEIVTGDSTVVKLVNLILGRAIRDGASDVHIEPDEGQLRIRYRVNGVMREEAAPPKKLQPEIISRIKIVSNLDVSEKRLPQDGRTSIRVGENEIDLRVSTLPTIHGEKIVVRILDRRKLKNGLPELGMNETIMEKWRSYIRKPEGLLLISGPTSSGKTSTLYASLQEINDVEKNIVTVEDPVEYSLPMINQLQINEKAGLSFASSLRSILRQNPDIIMVGEIRDTDTAAIAIRAALTGHLVMSTIHTNDSIATVTRLIDMGIDRYMVASALEVIVAQRLVRTICPECKEETSLAETGLSKVLSGDISEGLRLFKGVGCLNCRGTGFAGLTGIFELVEITDRIRDLILELRGEATIREEATRNGFIPLFDSGLELVRLGITTLDEILKVTNPVIHQEPESRTPAGSLTL